MGGGGGIGNCYRNENEIIYLPLPLYDGFLQKKTERLTVLFNSFTTIYRFNTLIISHLLHKEYCLLQWKDTALSQFRLSTSFSGLSFLLHSMCLLQLPAQSSLRVTRLNSQQLFCLHIFSFTPYHLFIYYYSIISIITSRIRILAFSPSPLHTYPLFRFFSSLLRH